jgi:hypothetical protein
MFVLGDVASFDVSLEIGCSYGYLLLYFELRAIYEVEFLDELPDI